MLELYRLIFRVVVDLFRPRAELEAEILVLRQQINVLRRASPRRLPFSLIDRLILGRVCRLFPKVYDALAIVRPDTVIRWHRAGFRSYWRWKSRRRCGRSTVSLEVRRLIREMSIAIRCGERRESMVSFSSLASISARPAWPSIWRGGGPLRRKAGRRSFVTTLMVSPRWPFRGADNLLSFALWPADNGPWSAADPVVWGHRSSDGRMDRQSVH